MIKDPKTYVDVADNIVEETAEGFKKDISKAFSKLSKEELICIGLVLGLFKEEDLENEND